MEMSFFHNIIQYIHQHPHIGGLITFFVSFAESIAIIGSMIPGTLTMTAIGMLIGSDIMPFTSTLIWAVVGAFCGDYLSYWIGTHYNERLVRIWPFKKYPHWIERGKAFFHKHGGKSVVIGRFVGPVRSAIPLIAGLMHMKKVRFICAALPSALLWSLVYITPGIIVGMMSLALPPAAATKFILIVLGIVAFSWIFFIVIHLFFKALARLIDRTAAKFWSTLEQGPRTRRITHLLSRPDHPNQHRQLLLLLSAIVSFALFLWVFYAAVYNTGLAKYNLPLYELFRSLRTEHLDNFMLMFTILGDKHVMLGMALLVFIWLLFRRYIWAAFNWAILVVLSAGLAESLKLLYFSARPGGLLHGQVTSSFPSGHSILAVCLLGFLGVLIAERAQSYQKKITFCLSFFLIFFVALSRIFLGAHWLTDVLASLFLGLAVLSFVVFFYRHRVSRIIPYGQLSLVAGLILAILGLGYGFLNFKQLQEDYTLYWPKVTLGSETWWHHETTEIPYFVASRLGKPLAVLNVQWMGSLEDIQKDLQAQGWQNQVLRMNIKSTLHRLSPKTNPSHLPLLPTLYQNQAPILFFTKKNHNGSLHFILWRSNITVQDQQQPLWLGSIYYYVPKSEKLWVSVEQKHKMYQEAADQLQNINNAEIKYLQVHENQIPHVMHPLDWDGTLVLIKNND